MICKQCAWAADGAIVKDLNPKTMRYVNRKPEHCNRNDCMCQHRTLPREEYLKEAK